MSKRKKHNLPETQNQEASTEDNQVDPYYDEEYQKDMEKLQFQTIESLYSDSVIEEPTTEERKITLNQAIQELTIGIRSDMIMGIRARAGLMSIDLSKYQTVQTWVDLFVAWGGHGIIK